jgi:hypothetical protein
MTVEDQMMYRSVIGKFMVETGREARGWDKVI